MFQVVNSFIRSWSASGRDISPESLIRLFDNFKTGKVIYKTRHKACYLVDEAVSGLPCKAVVKHYFEKRFWRYFLRPSLAYREFLGFKRAQECGIPAAEVLALKENRSLFRLKEAFFVTRFLEDYRDGNEFVQGMGDERLKDGFIRQNLALLAKLHNAGFTHGGFHPRNELFQVDGEGKMEVVWIDLATVMPAGKDGQKEMKNDLDRFMCEFAFPAEKEAEYRSFYAQNRAK